MDTAKSFSIIIPTLNEAQAIIHCLSALQGLRERCEIIVVDGDSVDNTRMLAQPLADQVLLTGRGRAIQMNLGAAKSEGKLLIFLHSDTFMPENALDMIAKNISELRQWGRFDVMLTGSHPMLKVVACLMNWRSRLTGIATGDQVMFITKQSFDKVGGFPELALMEDIALCKKLKQFSQPICLSAKVASSGRRWEQFGVFRTIMLMWNLRLRYFFGADPELLAQLYRKGRFWKT